MTLGLHCLFLLSGSCLSFFSFDGHLQMASIKLELPATLAGKIIRTFARPAENVPRSSSLMNFLP